MARQLMKVVKDLSLWGHDDKDGHDHDDDQLNMIAIIMMGVMTLMG